MRTERLIRLSTASLSGCHSESAAGGQKKSSVLSNSHLSVCLALSSTSAPSFSCRPASCRRSARLMSPLRQPSPLFWRFAATSSGIAGGPTPDSRSYSIRRQLTQFTIVSVIGGTARAIWNAATFAFFGALSTSLVQTALPAYHPSALDQRKLGTMIAMFIGVIIVMFLEFSGKPLLDL